MGKCFKSICIDVLILSITFTLSSPALAIYFWSAASIDLSNCWSSHARLHLTRKRGLIFASAFILRCCRRVCSLAVSHEGYCFLKGSQDCVTLNLTKTTTVELKLCEPRMMVIGCEGDCGVTEQLSLWIVMCLPCEVCMLISGILKGKTGPCRFLFIPLQNNYHITRWKN